MDERPTLMRVSNELVLLQNKDSILQYSPHKGCTTSHELSSGVWGQLSLGTLGISEETDHDTVSSWIGVIEGLASVPYFFATLIPLYLE